MGRAKLALIVAVLALPLWAGAAAARVENSPPPTVLVTNRGTQSASVYTYEWSGRPQGGLCMSMVADGFRSWPSPVGFLPGDDMALRFAESDRPNRIRLTVYPAVNPFTNDPIGPSEHPAVHFERGARGSWLATFEPPPWPDLYMDAAVSWPWAGYCSPHRAFMAFHARVG